MSLDIWLYVAAKTGNPERSSVEIDGTSQNYTHNVSRMWTKAGCWDALYESAGKRAGETLPVLDAAIAAMEADPDAYIALNPPNGWGDYESALHWLKRWREIVATDPDALIGVSA